MPLKIAWRNSSFTIQTLSDWELADNWLFKFQDKYLYCHISLLCQYLMFKKRNFKRKNQINLFICFHHLTWAHCTTLLMQNHRKAIDTREHLSVRVCLAKKSKWNFRQVEELLYSVGQIPRALWHYFSWRLSGLPQSPQCRIASEQHKG